MIQIVFLWHMHQPFYKDLVTGEYRLPWVRMHALKDYYGMVKLLDEFPDVHVTFNLVPSLIAQLQDYVAGTASDPFLDVALKPSELTQDERRFALQYLFQANHTHLISRYPRLLELYEKYRAYNHNAPIAERHFTTREIVDLQVLSQLCWFDEFFLKDTEVQALVVKGRDYTTADQQVIGRKQGEIMAAVLPAYRSAADRSGIEVSTSPFYHPILPLLCDTDVGAVSKPGLPLPKHRFQHPEDAREQLKRGLDLHQQLFGKRPEGVWPSEGSISEETLAVAHELGVKWMATDEGVLGRTLGVNFIRDAQGILPPQSAEQLYKVYRYKKDAAEMRLLFRDHSLSDLIGFVYSGMPAGEAAEHFISRLKACAKPIVAAGRTPVVPVILDGENAWEFFPESGREFLRRLYACIQNDPELQGLTVSEAIAEIKPADEGQLQSLAPGSWINSNFNVWIGSPEDNLAWDYLAEARELYERKANTVSPEQRKLAYEELLIAEGSDWNWWYGPEHSTANDREFDELYRKHLSNVYQALGETPSDYLAQPIIRGQRGAEFIPQSAYIRPTLDGSSVGYFDWIGAARYRADTHTSAMHGKRFLLETGYVGMDEKDLYCRLDFSGDLFSEDESGAESLSGTFEVVQSMECIGADASPKGERIRLVMKVVNGKRQSWELDAGKGTERSTSPDVVVHLGKVLETRISLDFLNVRIGDTIAVRFSIWENTLPVDSLPHEGAIHIDVKSEEELSAMTVGERWKV